MSDSSVNAKSSLTRPNDSHFKSPFSSRCDRNTPLRFPWIAGQLYLYTSHSLRNLTAKRSLSVHSPALLFVFDPFSVSLLLFILSRFVSFWGFALSSITIFSSLLFFSFYKLAPVPCSVPPSFGLVTVSQSILSCLEERKLSIVPSALLH